MKQEFVIESKSQLVKLLNKKSLSEKEIIKILKEKELDNKDTQLILDSLKRMGLINDEYCASILIDGCLLKRKGKLEIIKKLRFS